MPLKRFSMVPVDSSAARMPLPGATMALAMSARAVVVMGAADAESCVELRWKRLILPRPGRPALLADLYDLHGVGAADLADRFADGQHDEVAFHYQAVLHHHFFRLEQQLLAVAPDSVSAAIAFTFRW